VGAEAVKIAVTGKGGVGKTTIAAALARAWHERGLRVVAVDADPDANLAGTLGHRGAPIEPLATMRTLVNQRVGEGGWDGFLRMNPQVDDIPKQCGVDVNGIRVLVMGTIEKARRGCACPENVLLREVLSHLVLRADEHVVVDMEAGVEHLGRATAEGVDAMLIVVEPGWASIETAARVARLARELGVSRVFSLANKVAADEDHRFIEENLAEPALVGMLPFDREIERDAREGRVHERAFYRMMADVARRLEEPARKGEEP
jgi:CO dehydrogenase maturation factor